MTKAQIARLRKAHLPKYIQDLSKEWECGCMEKIIDDYAGAKIETEEMYCRIISFLVKEINGMNEEMAERN